MAGKLNLQPSGLPCAHFKSCLAVLPALRTTTRSHRLATKLCCRAENGDPYGSSSSSSSSSSSVPDCLPIAGVDTDWRSFRAKLVASSSSTHAPPETDECWAHSLPLPEKGCLLLANPLMFTQQQRYFYQSVILIIDHGPEGSMGIILNKPVQQRIGDVFSDHDVLHPEFNSCRLHLGGDVDRGAIFFLHGQPGLEGSSEIVKNVYAGGVAAAKKGIAEGLYDPDQFKFYSRYAGWGPGQLEEECRRGTWYTAAASHHVILQPTLPGTESSTWLAVMQLLGGDYAAMAEATVETYRPDIMGLVDSKKSGMIETNTYNKSNNNNNNAYSKNGVEDAFDEEEREEESEDSSLPYDADEMGGSGI